MQINPWALPALLLTATSSFQQEKKHSSVVHSEHYRDQFCFKAPFPSSMSFALIYSESEGSRTSTPRITLPWWRKETGGAWLPRVPPVPLKRLPAPWHLSKAPEHQVTALAPTRSFFPKHFLALGPQRMQGSQRRRASQHPASQS